MVGLPATSPAGSLSPPLPISVANPTTHPTHSMQAEIQTVSQSRSVLLLSAGAEDAKAIRDEVLKTLAKRASLPGFRPGKAPLALVQRKFADRIASEAQAKLESTAFEKAVADNKLDVFDIVSVEDRKTEPDGAFSFKVTVDLQPSPKLPALDGIPVDDEDTRVTDEAVQERIDSIRRSLGEYDPLPDGTPAEMDDSLQVSYVGRLEDGTPLAEAIPGAAGIFAQNDDSRVYAGSDYYLIPGVPAAVIGKKAGDAFDVPVAFPADFFKDELKGKKAIYAIKVASVSRIKLPEMDEAFCKKVGVPDAETLRDNIRKNMEAAAAQGDRVRRVNQIARYLAASSSFEVPASALERETDEQLSNLLRYNMDRGVAKEDLSKEREKLHETARQHAEERLRASFAIDAAGRQLGTELTGEEFNGYLNHLVRERNMSQADIKELTRDRAALRRHHADALREKVLSELLKKAQPTPGVK